MVPPYRLPAVASPAGPQQPVEGGWVQPVKVSIAGAGRVTSGYAAIPAEGGRATLHSSKADAVASLAAR